VRRILVFGNSGSGKSTLAARLCVAENLSHLDLDTLAWLPLVPPVRRALESSQRELADFIEAHQSWIIEGCYSDLLALAVPYANEAIYMNLSIDACVANAKRRPWEPHKYGSKEAQDENLEMLIGWIRQYDERNDACSRSAHTHLYESFAGKKSTLTGYRRVT
jgi:adenylate kinase family enzyme